jgi:molybdopterin synthase sulfur carrier subunit
MPESDHLERAAATSTPRFVETLLAAPSPTCSEPSRRATSSRMSPATTVTIQVPGPLRAYCDGASELSVSASSVRQALHELEQRYPDLYSGVCDETGAVRRHVNVFVNTSNVRDGEGLDTALAPGDVVTILPAVSGG